MNKSDLERIKKRIAKSISLLDPSVDKGRVIPDPTDLVIGDGRELNLAVMFIDISGYTSWALSSSSDQENALKRLNLFMSEMFRIATDYSGVIEKNTGDGLMAYFEGNGDSPEIDACKNAIDAALTMFYATNKIINPILVDSGYERIKFRIGIDFGRVTIAKIGTARLFSSIVAVGISANIACKMLKDAGPGQIILGEDVYNRLSEYRKQYCKLLKMETGFVIKQYESTKHYPFYHYNSEWKDPV